MNASSIQRLSHSPFVDKLEEMLELLLCDLRELDRSFVGKSLLNTVILRQLKEILQNTAVVTKEVGVNLVQGLPNLKNP